MAERDEPRGPRRPDADLELLRLAGPRPSVPPEREERVRQAVRAYWHEAVHGRRRRRMVWLAVPLAAAALIALVILLPQPRPAPPALLGAVEVVTGQARIGTPAGDAAASVGMELTEGTAVTTDDRGRVALRLGTASVRLDASSRVVLASSTRLSLERGAIYVDAQVPTAGGGLTIGTPLADVLELGTQFEVRLLDDHIRVRVREGAVSLLRGNPVHTLAAGEEASLARDGTLQIGRFAGDDLAWQWVLAVAPPFLLEGSSAASFLRWSARETGLDLRWASPEVAAAAESIVLHGDATGVPPDQAPAAVLPTCGLAHRLDNGMLVVSRLER
jgi:ferric-dicitrate binding protein FerR (iron transport regulator)